MVVHRLLVVSANSSLAAHAPDDRHGVNSLLSDGLTDCSQARDIAVAFKASTKDCEGAQYRSRGACKRLMDPSGDDLPERRSAGRSGQEQDNKAGFLLCMAECHETGPVGRRSSMCLMADCLRGAEYTNRAIDMSPHKNFRWPGHTSIKSVV